MKVKELLRIKPDEVHIGHLLLENGETVVSTLKDLDALGELPTEEFSVADFARAIKRLSPEQQQIFLEKDMDPIHDVPQDPELNEAINLLMEDGGKTDREAVGRNVTYAMVVCVLIIVGVIAYVSIVTKQFPDTMLSIISVGFLAMIGWFYMGLINKERRDILSVIVGDKVNSGFVDSVLNWLTNRKRK